MKNNTIKDGLVKELISGNCIKIGNWKLKNGDVSKYYFNMKNIISNPSLLKRIGDELYKKLNNFDVICGIPHGGMPIACYISTTYNKPMIFIRDSKKTYGTANLIEGEYKPTDKCVIIDDVLTTGGSILESVFQLQDKINIVDIGVIMNRQQHTLKTPVKSVFSKNDIVRYRLKQISREKKSKLCFSADIEDPEKLLTILDNIGKYIVICKIHYDIIDTEKLSTDLNFQEELIKLSIKHDFLIMEDRKFIDISSIVSKQYSKFNNWIDLVTVHGSVSSEVIRQLSGALIVANMSNNTYDLTPNAITLAEDNPDNVIGFITQTRIDHNNLVCMTPGIALQTGSNNDQKYRSVKNIDTDFIIVGRAIYNSENIDESVQKFLSK